MILKVSPSTLSGSVQAPSSKSLSIRLIAASLLANTPSKLLNISECDDCTHALELAAGLGAEIELGSNGVIITPTPLGIPCPREGELNAGESGLSIRLFTPIAALSGKELTVTAEGSLLKRPLTDLISCLKDLDLCVTENNSCAPLKINGCLNGGEINLDGGLSSQSLTGLLLSLPFADNDSTIRVKNLKSRPYVEMTLEVMRNVGLEFVHEENEDMDVFQNSS